MTMIVNVYDAKTRLSALLTAVESGEDVVIARSGRPVVRLIPFREPSGERPGFGSARGQIVIAPDFDDAMPDLDEFDMDEPRSSISIVP
jgi:prevent-host-death family protein